ncbi:Uncharacterized protein FKW44_011122, partial [Caligus rogercresseyi]
MSNASEHGEVKCSSSSHRSWRKNFIHKLKLRTNKLYEWEWKKQSVTQSDPDPGGGCRSGSHEALQVVAASFGGTQPVMPLRADTLPRNISSHGPSSLFPPLIRSNSTGTTASVTSSDYGFQDWGKMTPRTTILQGSRGGRSKPGKSVRFGENRINVFLQDSGQIALEEAVKLALTYAAGSSERPGVSSDSEAVLQRGEASNVPFFSDSETHPVSNGGKRLLNPSEREVVFQGTNGSTGLIYSSTTVTKSSIPRDKFRRRRSKKNINEIFSFIDKVLSGCNNEEGCSDSDCPVNRKRRRRRRKRIPAYPNHIRPLKSSNIYDSDDSDEESGSVASSASTYQRKRLHRSKKAGARNSSYLKGPGSLENLFNHFPLDFEDLSASSSSTGTCMPFFSH